MSSDEPDVPGDEAATTTDDGASVEAVAPDNVDVAGASVSEEDAPQADAGAYATVGADFSTQSSTETSPGSGPPPVETSFPLAEPAPGAPANADTVAGPVDRTLMAALDVARAAAAEEAGPYSRIGEHLGAWAVAAGGGAKAAVHAFAATDPGYVGWYWAVEVARVPRGKTVSVDDVVLLPGADALLAPAWVPWSERLRPGDVGVGDILPTAADDPRLALRLTDTEGWVDDTLWFELGLGRPRVLSALGRDDAADRWYDGEFGPTSDMAKAAPAHCGSCGFYVGLVGTLGHVFGVCGNEMAPADGRVVSTDHGCGAHSEAWVLPSGHPSPISFDDAALEIVAVTAHSPGSVDDSPEDETGGHS